MRLREYARRFPLDPFLDMAKIIGTSLVDDLVQLPALSLMAAARLPHTGSGSDYPWRRRWDVSYLWVTGSAVTQAHRVHGWL